MSENIKIGIKGNFKDIGFYDTLKKPIIPEQGLVFLPWETYTYSMSYNNINAKAIYIFTGNNLMSVIDYPGKVAVKELEMKPEQIQEEIIRMKTCKEINEKGYDFTKNIEYIEGKRIGPFEDLFLCNDDLIIETPYMDNPTRIKIKHESGKTRYIAAFQFCEERQLEKNIKNYLENFMTNKLWYFTNRKVMEYNERFN